MIKVYFSKKNSKYYALTDEGPYICSHCCGEIYAAMILNLGFTQASKECDVYCMNCIRHARSKMSKFRVVDGHTVVGLVSRLPEDAVPVLFRPPNLVQRKDTDVWMAANIATEKTVDKAWRSRHKNFMIDSQAKTAEQIEQNNRMLELEAAKKDEPLDEVGFLSMLDNIVNSVPMIEGEQRQQIEAKPEIKVRRKKHAERE